MSCGGDCEDGDGSDGSWYNGDGVDAVMCLFSYENEDDENDDGGVGATVLYSSSCTGGGEGDECCLSSFCGDGDCACGDNGGGGDVYCLSFSVDGGK